MNIKKHTCTNLGPNVSQWAVGTVKISLVEAIQVLGPSHAFETHSWETAGGREEYWMLELDSRLIVFFRLQVSYSQMVLSVICEEIPEDAWQLFSRLFSGYDQEKFDVPFNESCPDGK